MGDPETQPIMMRLKSDLVAICKATLDGTLGEAGSDLGRARIAGRGAGRRRIPGELRQRAKSISGSMLQTAIRRKSFTPAPAIRGRSRDQWRSGTVRRRPRRLGRERRGKPTRPSTRSTGTTSTCAATLAIAQLPAKGSRLGDADDGRSDRCHHGRYAGGRQSRLVRRRLAGRVLRQTVLAERDQPPFDRVTMDGIAIAFADFEKGTGEFPMQAMQAAGDAALTLDAGNCIEIMTGASLPAAPTA